MENKEWWEDEWEILKKDFIAIPQGEWWNSDEDFIKMFIVKALQKERERIIGIIKENSYLHAMDIINLIQNNGRK